MSSIIDSLPEAYIAAYRELIETERGERSVTLSLPFHLAANHRIEVTVTDLGRGVCIVSDSARTLGEIQAAGYTFSTQMKAKIEAIGKSEGIRIVDNHLILESSYASLGSSIQKFLEVSKVIGDVYLVYKHRESPDERIGLEVQEILQSEGLPYRMHEKIPGELERHPFDVVVPSNGHRGIAVAILAGLNTHMVAQVWGYKCDDIRKGAWYQSSQNRLILIYDIRHSWSATSRAILESRADLAVPSDSLMGFAEAVRPT